MTNQWLHVLNTYLHRKLFWFVAFIYLASTFADWTMPVRETPRLWQQTQVRWLPDKTFNGVTDFVQWPATDSELQDLKNLTIDGSFLVANGRLSDNGQPLNDLKRDSEVTPAFLNKLRQCVHLHELHLRSFKLTPELGEALARLPNLHQLELTLIGTPVASMANLPSLDHLRYFQVPQVPLSELGLLSKHPELTTIELQDWHGVPSNRTSFQQAPSTLNQATQVEQVILKPVNQHVWNIMYGRSTASLSPEDSAKAVPFTQSLVDSLAQLPNLKAVEVRDPWGGWPARTIQSPQLNDALAKRPEVSINAMIRSAEAFANPFSYFATFAVIVVLLIQLFDQFGSSMSRTVPRFARAHLLVAGVLLGTQLLFAAFTQTTRLQIAWLPSLALVAAIPAMLSLAVGCVTRYPRLLPFAFALMIWCIVGFTFTRGLLVKILGGDDFLQATTSAMQGKSLLMVAGEFAMIGWAVIGIVRLSVHLEEAHLPSGLGVVQTMKQLQLQKIDRSKIGRPERRPAWRWLDNKLNKFLSIPPQLDQTTYRRRQWLAANANHWLVAMFACIIAPWAMVGVFVATFGILSGSKTSIGSYAYYSLFAGTFCWALYSLIMSSYQLMRRPVLEQELMRPIWRNEFNQRLLETAWVTSWPAMVATVLYLVLLAVLSSIQLPGDDISQRIAQLWLPHAMLTLAVPLPILAVSTFVLTIISEFWRGVIAFAVYFSLFIAVQGLITGRLFANAIASPVILVAMYTVVAVCLLVALVLHWQCHKRLSRFQWGLSTS